MRRPVSLLLLIIRPIDIDPCGKKRGQFSLVLILHDMPSRALFLEASSGYFAVYTRSRLKHSDFEDEVISAFNAQSSDSKQRRTS